MAMNALILRRLLHLLLARCASSFTDLSKYIVCIYPGEGKAINVESCSSLEALANMSRRFTSILLTWKRIRVPHGYLRLFTTHGK